MLDWNKDLSNFYKIITNNIDYLKSIWSKSLNEVNTIGEDKEDKDKSITSYSLDKYNFRIYKNQNFNDTIFCYGCSNTFGEGLSDEYTWPFQLGQLLQTNVKNYGIRGSSKDKITWTIYNTLSLHAKNNSLPKYFFVLFPDIFRYISYYVKNDKVFYKSRFFTYKENIYETFYSDFLDSLSDCLLNSIKKNKKDVLYFAHNTILDCFMSFVKDFKFIDTIAKLYNIKWFWSTWDPVLIKLKQKVIYELLDSNTFINDLSCNTHLKISEDVASDKLHIGPKYSEYIAKEFKSLI